MDRDRQGEREPLLQPQTDGHVDGGDSEAGGGCVQTTNRKALPIIILAITIMFIFNVGNQFITSPQVRIYEDIICRKYYDSHGERLYPVGEPIPEEKCKIAPVESELALIRGLEPVFDAIPSLLAAIPMGMLADNPKVGRKPVILAALLGSMAQLVWTTAVTWFSDTLPLRLVWTGSFFLITGGSEVTNAILYTMIIDITTPSELASTFFMMQLVGGWLPLLFGPPVTSAMMIKKGNWLPVFIGIFLSFTGFVLLCFAPETMHIRNRHPKDSTSEDVNHAASSSTSSAAVTVETFETSSDAGPMNQKLRARAKERIREFIESSSFVFHSPHLIILICSLMMNTVTAMRAMEMVLYYASARYNISIAKVNLLNTVNAAVSISILSALPLASAFLTGKLGFSSQRKDLLIAKVSVMLYAIGWAGVGFAPTLACAIAALVIITFGSGFGGSVRSLAASYVEPHHQARLASFTAIMIALGNFVGAPALAGLYRLGLSMGDSRWYGLPFLGLASVFVIISSALWLVLRLPEDGEPVIEDDTSSENIN
ncbi:hypothetical protein TWF696_006528 [Orbilia brochopaga]|uniref:Major facilitator superfamily (MFS) profile domain-containing protein n=1 Tax=Orbilia brochopaga TaxID=3140254 RepID=A0AAV9UXY6_9PEZI